MRRKNIYIILFAVMAYAFTGCSDFLDTRLDTLQIPERMATQSSTISSFANSYYTPLQYGFTMIDNNLFAAASDEAYQTAPSSNVQIFNIGAISPDRNPIASLYSNYYDGIRAAYFFIDYAKDGEDFLALYTDTAAVYNLDGSVYHTENKRSYERNVINLNWQRAEAMIAVAYYYSELIKMYGGVPIVTTTMDKDQNVGRLPHASYDEVVEHIVKLIDDYKDKICLNWEVYLDDGIYQYADVSTWNFRTNTGRFDKLAALAIKSRTLLYAASPRNNPGNDQAKWVRAAQAAYDVIKTREEIFAKGFGATRTPQDPKMPENRDYGAYFLTNTSVADLQSIFLIRRAQGNAPETRNYPVGTRGGNSGVTPSQNLVDAYEYIGPQTLDPYVNRDPRLLATVVVNGSQWNGVTLDQSSGGQFDMSFDGASKTGYYLKKFLHPNLNLVEGGTTDHVWPVYRYAEILLSFAEAMNEAYGPDNAAGFGLTARQALMEVRNSASTLLPPVTTTNRDEFRAAIKHERQVEFAFEDHRYWDLIRWGDAYTVLNQPIRGVVVDKNTLGAYTYQYTTVAPRVFLSHHNYLPFPRYEITNSGGTLKQNPGYN